MAADERQPLVVARSRRRRRILPLACAAALAGGVALVRRQPDTLLLALPAPTELPTLVTQQAYLNGPTGAQRMVLSWGHGTLGLFEHETGNMVQGPTRRIPLNAEVTLTLENALLSDTTSVHHHGVHMVGTPYYDGAFAITQPGLPAGGSQTLTFTAEPYGTHWYHSHVGMQYGDGLKGLFIVEDPEDPYLDSYSVDDALLFSEWGTTSTYEGWTVNIRAPFEPNAVWPKTDMPAALVNGVPSVDFDLQTTPGYVVEVEAGSAARLRLCYGGYNYRFHVRIEDHTMRVIAKDGTYVKPVEVQQLRVYGAERYDVLVATNRTGDFTMRFQGFMHGMGPDYPRSLGAYGDVNATLRVVPPGLPAEKAPAAEDRAAEGPPARDILDLATQFGALRSDDRYWAGPPPARADREVPVVITAGFATEDTQDGQTRLPPAVAGAVPNGASDRSFWRVNNESWVDPAEPLYTTKGARGVWDRHPYDATKLIFPVKMGEVIDIVVKNVGVGSDPMMHPLHLHGYKFWVVAQGRLPFPDDPAEVDYNLADPVFADTFPVFTGDYAVFRVVFDNPGMWHFHCHLLFHMGLGLQSVFNVAEELQPEPPPSYFRELSGF